LTTTGSGSGTARFSSQPGGLDTVPPHGPAGQAAGSE